MLKRLKERTAIELIVGVIVMAGVLYVAYYFYTELTQTKAELQQTTQALIQKQKEAEDLNLALIAEQKKNGDFENQIGEISNVVGNLQKLNKTDKELLQKYSKIYFLNENYIPEALSKISTDLLSDTSRELEFHTKALPFLQRLITSSNNAGLHILVASAYRSFGAQTALKSAYKVTYGTGANKFSADQGYSEHQLGTTVDLSTKALAPEIVGFDKTPEYQWLLQNAYLYGFVISYPSGNTYYQFEPWHFRFVGVKLSTDLHDMNKNFYDLDQRQIDTYLLNIFD